MDADHLLNMVTVDGLREMDEGSGFFAELMTEFIDQCSRLIGEIMRGVAEHDITRIRFAVHTLKGSSYNVGAEAQAQVCEQIEMVGRTEDFDTIAALAVELGGVFAKTTDALRTLI